jgi:hypothetical protein
MYHDHPRYPAARTTLAGITQDGSNPLVKGLLYYTPIATTRQLGRPFTCSEWGQVFWNPYRYQAGVTIPAYAALQGWQMIAQFTDPIHAPHRKQPTGQMPIGQFRLFNDLPLKAGEYISALLFRRGDLQKSPHNVEMVIDPQATGRRLQLQNSPDAAFGRVALVCGLGVRVPDWPGAAPRGNYHADLSVTPEETQQIATQDGAQNVVAANTPAETLQAMFTRLHAAGILPPDNNSDPARGLYESDTGQIQLDEQAGTIRINSPLSQGGSVFPGEPGLQLPNFEVKVSGADGTVYAGSLTELPLATSRRILLLLVTDALNSGMTFTDSKRHQLVALGQSPVLMRIIQADIVLHNSAPGKAHLWALGANGERAEEIPLSEKDGSLIARIDTGGLHNGPTPYFEIIRSE